MSLPVRRAALERVGGYRPDDFYGQDLLVGLALPMRYSIRCQIETIIQRFLMSLNELEKS